MRKNFTAPDFFPFLLKKMQIGQLPLFVALLCFVFPSCNWSTGVFEKNQSFHNQEWPSSLKPELAFEISDTVSPYNIYIVLRHTDAYHFNNIYIRATVKEPGEGQGKTGDYDLQLATNNKGWIGTAMDDIYDARLLIQPATRFRKPGIYHITLEQLMREDPLKSVLSAGLRVELAQ
jgi:gliding motility-associated lipoprotein GldH